MSFIKDSRVKQVLIKACLGLAELCQEGEENKKRDENILNFRNIKNFTPTLSIPF
jgi:hypothetical protein